MHAITQDQRNAGRKKIDVNVHTLCDSVNIPAQIALLHMATHVHVAP